MVFCNLKDGIEEIEVENGHNPYFNRWFSAIKIVVLDCITTTSHNPYFNRWFSAI